MALNIGGGSAPSYDSPIYVYQEQPTSAGQIVGESLTRCQLSTCRRFQAWWTRSTASTWRSCPARPPRPLRPPHLLPHHRHRAWTQAQGSKRKHERLQQQHAEHGGRAGDLVERLCSRLWNGGGEEVATGHGCTLPTMRGKRGGKGGVLISC